MIPRPHKRSSRGYVKAYTTYSVHHIGFEFALCLSRSSHSCISLLTQQSLTLGSSYTSNCFFPFRRRCSIAEMSLAETENACVLKVYRTKVLNLGCVDGGLVWTIRSALSCVIKKVYGNAAGELTGDREPGLLSGAQSVVQTLWFWSREGQIHFQLEVVG